MRMKSSLGVSCIVSMAVLTTSFAACKDKESEDVAAFHELTVALEYRSIGKGTLTVSVEGVVKCSSTSSCRIAVDREKSVTARIEPNPGFVVDRWYSPEDRDVRGCSGSSLAVELTPRGIAIDNATTQACEVALKPDTLPDGGGSDARPDGPVEGATAGGMLRATVSKTGAYVEGLLDLTEADLAAMTGPDDYVFAAAGLAPGKCSMGPWNVPMKPNPNKVGKDLGPVSLKDGATTFVDLTFMDGRYTGNINMPAFGKTLDLAAMDTNKLPSLVAGLLAPASGPIDEIEPATPVVVRNQTANFKWKPFTTDVFILTVPGSAPVCRLDSTTGSFDIPAEITAMFTPGTFKTFLFQQMTRRTVPAMINGTPRSLRGYALSTTAVTGDVQ